MQNPMEQPHIQLAIMSRWYVVSRAIHTVAQLGVANHMADTPVASEAIARLVNANPQMLDRLLRFLSAYGIFSRHGNSYALTALSKPLRDDAPNSVRDVIRMVDDSWWQAFSQLDKGLQQGESAFSLQHHEDFFSFLANHPEKQNNFDRGMAKLSTFDDSAVSKAVDFSQCETIVDMGGGRGGLSKALAQHYPSLQVTLFDSPAVINQLSASDFPAQVTLQAGNFFEAIPQAQAYIFKGVLHDFSDELMHKILSNCAARMPADARLFIAEQVMPDDDKPHPNKTMDIVMMALLNGRQRTLTEWQQIIEPSGFQFKAAYVTDTLFTVMEFLRA
ncbi:methyltransferase [Legionella dresdenensis]|uniref:Methyltransferase n=1 Tax=Legionella dresdenensis TaxID=450200 RepID=A0ABV8CBU6_9GAMM